MAGSAGGDLLSAEDREWITQTVAGWGPLPAEHRRFLAWVFRKD